MKLQKAIIMASKAGIIGMVLDFVIHFFYLQDATWELYLRGAVQMMILGVLAIV